MKTIEIKTENAIAAYNNANSEGKKLLVDLFGKQNLLLKITDRVKTFADAVEVIGGITDNQKILLDYNGMDGDMISSQAHLKLTIIARALNEGWKPDWTNVNEYKYVPLFKHKSGFGLSYFVCDCWGACTFVGSRLCFKSSELAEYAATQFADVYNDFLTIK